MGYYSLASVPWILFAVAGLVILLGILMVAVFKKLKRPTDYYALFITGIIWTVIGIPLGNNVLFILGVVFMIIGMTNKDKWKKNRLTWAKMTDSERKFRMALIIVLSVLVLAGLVMFLLFERGII